MFVLLALSKQSMRLRPLTPSGCHTLIGLWFVPKESEVGLETYGGDMSSSLPEKVGGCNGLECSGNLFCRYDMPLAI